MKAGYLSMKGPPAAGQKMQASTERKTTLFCTREIPKVTVFAPTALAGGVNEAGPITK